MRRRGETVLKVMLSEDGTSAQHSTVLDYVLSCKNCGVAKTLDQFYRKGGQKPSWCKCCELAAKAARRKAKKKVRLATQKQAKTRKVGKVLDIATFEVVELYEPQAPDNISEVIHDYIEKVVSERTLLKPVLKTF